MKLPSNPRELTPQLLRDICAQLNAITEGNMYAHHGAMTAAPASGTWAKGDFVLNSNPVETGTGGMKYIVRGWECVSSGTPGTWVEVRTFTGGGLNFSKLLAGSATLDFPSIASNSSASLTITVTGAVVGDPVIAAPPASLDSNLGFVSYVSAADTVTVRVHNNSGGAIDPASATWKVTVFAFA